MSCTEGITQNISGGPCVIISGGVKQTGWAFNREDIDYDNCVVVGNKITTIALFSGKIAYSVEQVKKSWDNTGSLVVKDNAPNNYKHKVMLIDPSRSSAGLLNAENMENMVFVFENVEQSAAADGTFTCFGWNAGLYKTKHESQAWANNGASLIELETQADSAEKHIRYVVTIGSPATNDTTRAALNGFLD